MDDGQWSMVSMIHETNLTPGSGEPAEDVVEAVAAGDDVGGVVWAREPGLDDDRKARASAETLQRRV
jgi:hypothetical protein